MGKMAEFWQKEAMSNANACRLYEIASDVRTLAIEAQTLAPEVKGHIGKQRANTMAGLGRVIACFAEQMTELLGDPNRVGRTDTRGKHEDEVEAEAAKKTEMVVAGE